MSGEWESVFQTEEPGQAGLMGQDQLYEVQ